MAEEKTYSSRLSPADVREIMNGKGKDAYAEYEAAKAQLEAEQDQPAAKAKVPIASKEGQGDAPDHVIQKDVASGTDGKESLSAKQTDSDSETVEERLARLEREQRLNSLLTERMQLEADKWRDVAQRRAGEIGFLKNKQKVVDPFAGSEPTWSDPTDNHSTTDDQSVIEDLKQRALQSVQQDAVRNFTGKYPGFQQDEEFQTVLKEKAPDYENELSSGQTRTVEFALNRLLNDARIETELRREMRRAEDAKTKKATIAQEVRQRKLDSAPNASATGVAAGNPNQTRYQSEEDFVRNAPIEEVKKFFANNRR